MFRIFVCSDHSNTVKESVPSLPRYAYVRSSEISPIIYEVRPDDGVRSSRFRLRALSPTTPSRVWSGRRRLRPGPGIVGGERHMRL